MDPAGPAGGCADEQTALTSRRGDLVTDRHDELEGGDRRPQLRQTKRQVDRFAHLHGTAVVDLGADDDGHGAVARERVRRAADLLEEPEAPDLQPPDVGDVADVPGEVDVEREDLEV